MKNRTIRLGVVLFLLAIASFTGWYGYFRHSIDLDAEARAFAEAFVRGDCNALWRYASDEERTRLSTKTLERLYLEFVSKNLNGVRLYTGKAPNAPKEFAYSHSVFPAVIPQEKNNYRYAVILQSGDGSVIRATLRLGIRGRRVEASVGQFFLEVARGYVGAHIPWDDRKTPRTLKALEKFGDVFRSAGMNEFYEFRTRTWFTLEEWEAFARSGRMAGSGFDWL